jgi:hypothetical protein
LLSGSAVAVSPVVVLVEVVVVSVVVVVLVVVLEPLTDSVFAGFVPFAGPVAFALVFVVVVVFGPLAVEGLGGFAGFCDTVVLTFGEEVVLTFGAGAVLTVGFGFGPFAAIASMGAVPRQNATAAATPVHTNFSNLMRAPSNGTVAGKRSASP